MAKTEQLQIRVSKAQKTALRRLAESAGTDLSTYVLQRALPDRTMEYREILSRLGTESTRKFAFAALDVLLVDLTPVEFGEVTNSPPPERAPLWVRNYVAAMVEEAAAQKLIAPPVWVRDVPVLREPHFVTDLKKLRPYLLRTTPVVYRRRNVFVDAGIGQRV